MKLLDKILIPISLNSYSYMQNAIELANKFNSKLILLLVLPEEARNKPENNYIRDAFSKVLKDIDSTSVIIDKRILYGNVFEQINLVAKNENVNLILISDEIEYAGTIFNIDQISEKLIRKSQKPVWIVKEGSKNFPKKILCSIDYSSASTGALNNAINIARTFNSKLHILNVLEPVNKKYSLRYKVDYALEIQRNKIANEKEFNAFLKKNNLTDIEYNIHIINGVLIKEIIQFINQNQIDVAFMGTGKNNVQRFFMGSTTEAVITSLPCSIVITKYENILNHKTDLDIKNIENFIASSRKLEEVIS